MCRRYPGLVSGRRRGNAVADILYGHVSPSGKLSVSYPNQEVYEPLCYNYSAEKDARVAWPFGYGLSYTTFEYSDLKINPEANTNDEAITLSFQVKNTGTVEADEMVQVYLSPADNHPNIRPIQLQGFARIKLAPGESKEVEVKMYIEQFGYYSNEGQRQWNIAPGKFTLKIGASSEDIRLSENIRLQGEKVVKPLRDFYFSESVIK